ncbi:MAG: hypothetical protein JO352_36360 [Chloroflexi bacterium]|nr:hypothetical protein [Chloroflexota bacterium]MBV9595807.1 hypothetical protein [Chloroflexota bacterium]
MNAARDLDPAPLDDAFSSADVDSAPTPVEPQPTLDDLSPEAAGRIVRYIVTSALEHGVAPTAVVALYADLAGEEAAVRYADRRFMLREVPPDWRDLENRVVDLEASARDRGLDLAAAWRRATSVAMAGQDALEQLSRLAGVSRAGGGSGHTERSIFDDPEDLDALEADDALDVLYERLGDRLPELLDLAIEAQTRIRRFAIEERLEHGLPPVELIDLYRGLEIGGDQRAQQYLDRVYVDHEPPADWLEIQSEAGHLVEMAEARGRDAGRLFAELLRTSPELEPITAMRLLMERLLKQR